VKELDVTGFSLERKDIVVELEVDRFNLRKSVRNRKSLRKGNDLMEEEIPVAIELLSYFGNHTMH
jgi:hypothetical protein